MSDNIIGFKANFKPKQHQSLERFIALLEQNMNDRRFHEIRAVLYPHDVKPHDFVGYVAGHMVSQIETIRDLLMKFLDKENSPQVPNKLVEALKSFEEVMEGQESVLVMNIPFIGENLHMVFVRIPEYGYVLSMAHWNNRSIFDEAVESYIKRHNTTLEDIFYYK